MQEQFSDGKNFAESLPPFIPGVSAAGNYKEVGGSSLVAQQVKDPELSLLRCRFDPWPRKLLHAIVGGTKEAFLEEVVLGWIINQLMSLSQVLVIGFGGHL